MFNQLSLLGMFPLWEGSNSRIFLSPFLFLSLGGSGREEGRWVLEVRKASPWWLEMLALRERRTRSPLPLSELHARDV